MTGTYQYLMSLDAAPLQTMADPWRKLATTYGTARQQHQSRVRGPLAAHWKGESGEKALTVLRTIEDQMTAGEIDALAMANILGEAHTDLQSAQNSLRSAVQEAEAAGLSVNDSGTVTAIIPAALSAQARQGPEQYTHDINQLNNTVDEYQHLINTALRNAETADHTACKALSAMNSHQLRDFLASDEAATTLDRVDKNLGITTASLPDGKNPKQNAAWWKTLTPDEQQSYIIENPRRIAGMDGLPAAARDQANRLYLEEFLNGGSTVPSNESVLWSAARDGAAANLQDRLDAPAAPGKEL